MKRGKLERTFSKSQSLRTEIKDLERMKLKTTAKGMNKIYTEMIDEKLIELNKITK